MTDKRRHNPVPGAHPFPKAAPPVFPLPGHRTLAQVAADEIQLANSRDRDRAMRLKSYYRRKDRAADPMDYGSPFAVRRSA